MINLKTMYPAQVNSPHTTILGEISTTDTAVVVSDVSVLPETVPFLLTLGFDKSASETVLVTAVSGNTLSIIRAVDGNALLWVAGTKAARVFTAKDLNDVQDNIAALNEGKQDPITIEGTAPVTVTRAGDVVTLEVGNASASDRGVVQLSSGVADTSTSKAATPKAVKTAYDLATQAKETADAAVPKTRKVNGKELSTDISLGAGDVGARPDTWTPSASDVGAAPASHSHTAADITDGTLPIARGGTGVTSNPALMVNLASTTTDTVFKASPRPGVTGTLAIANGGTGSTTAAGALSSLGALPIAGGTMTGPITLKSGTTAAVSAKGTTYTHPVLYCYEGPNNDGGAVILQGGGVTMIGGGEAATAVYANLGLSPGTERVDICSDNAIYVHTNCQTVTSKKTFTFQTDGRLTVAAGPSANLDVATKQYVDTQVGNIETLLAAL